MTTVMALVVNTTSLSLTPVQDNVKHKYSTVKDILSRKNTLRGRQ